VRTHSPSSHAGFSIRLSPFDIVVAAVAPILAVYLRLPGASAGFAAGVYCFVSLIFSLIGFAVLRIHGAVPRYLSMHDARDLALAVLAAMLPTCVVLFTFTRLEGIPRSVPAIHALLLGAGLIAVRAFARIAEEERRARNGARPSVPEHIILIGLNDLSVLFMKYLEAADGGERRVVAVLDENPRWYGRSVNGVRVYGPPAHLDRLIAEFLTHGVAIGRVVVGIEAAELSAPAAAEIRRVCAVRRLELAFLPQLFALDGDRRRPPPAAAAAAAPGASLASSPYFTARRAIDFAVALVLIAALAPFWSLAALIAFIDVGSPVLFWQQRIGRGGRAFHLYKFRTLRPAFGRDGRELPEERRLSRAGRFLRRTRLDELPQLVNVLVGDMALIGPRPLLPQDQPDNPGARLSVRPGITGWAQVNGGVLLSPAEKAGLDAWYIGHASPLLDLRILLLTVRSVVSGDRRPEPAAKAELAAAARRPVVSTRFAAAAGDRKLRGEARTL